jgi:hypothetical protein
MAVHPRNPEPETEKSGEGTGRNRAVIAFGSNIDPEPNIERAMREIRGFLTILGVSDFVTTRPVGNEDQPHFRNGAALVETGMGKEELEVRLHAVETGLGHGSGCHLVEWNCLPSGRGNPGFREGITPSGSRSFFHSLIYADVKSASSYK